ncbi:MAG: hypothetical protein GXP43_03245 [bacterium]|nr:hypothetical protein [bacterium]
MIKQALAKVFRQPVFVLLAVSTATNILFVYYLVLMQTTSWEVFWQSNVAFYNWAQVVLSVLTAVGFGIVIAQMMYVVGQRLAQGGSWLTSTASLIFSTAVTGCTVCGAVLLPTLGIAASLTALPFGGLEVKLMSLILVGWAVYEYSKVIVGACKVKGRGLITISRSGLEVNWSKENVKSLGTPLLIVAVFLLIVYSLPKLPPSLKIQFQKSGRIAPVQIKSTSKTQAGGGQQAGSAIDTEAVLAKMNPANGYEIKASYGDLGPRMIRAGVIDLAKFKAVYDRSGQSLTADQLRILTKGSNEKIRITSSNAYFLLNFFWAAGLGNKSKILTEGEISKYGKKQIGYFASTGGWTLAKGNAVDYLAKYRLIPLTAAQEALVERVSSNIYRPCCNNPTSFPDCNHGMALLGALQLMAASGASEAEMFEGAKYFNAFWFPQNYYDLALYFKATKGQDFDQINAKQLLSKDYSSVSGWQRTKNLLSQKGLLKQAPRSGGGCGV